MKKKLLWIIPSCILALILSGYILFQLVWNGVILLNWFAYVQYPVNGVDVSSYQGKIDWEKLVSQDIDFAFIKATEGSSFADKNFAYNYNEAQKTDIPIGAYHFFSYDSSGKTQAENFIKNVKAYDRMLPPVIDLEFYGDKSYNPPSKETVSVELQAMLDTLEEHYGVKPIIYAIEQSYDLYLAGGYEEYDIWIRNVKTIPKVSDNRQWTFWQFTNRERLEGYNGTEKFIDMNVYYGSREDFNKYLKDISQKIILDK